MIYTLPTVRLVNHCFTTSTTRVNQTGRTKRNMALYGSYQFVYIGQPSMHCPNASIIPKMHYMVHISRCHSQVIGRSLTFLLCKINNSFALFDCRFGPARNIWTMRFEAKHTFFKRMVSKNFKNIPRTLSIRHQRFMFINAWILNNIEFTCMEPRTWVLLQDGRSWRAILLWRPW